MNRAFVKAPGGDQVALERPQRQHSCLPGSMARRGLEALRLKVVELKATRQTLAAQPQRLGKSIGDVGIWRRPVGDLEIGIVTIDYPG